MNTFVIQIQTKNQVVDHSSLYSEEQLAEIDSLINANMDQHLELLVAGKIQSMLEDQMHKYSPGKPFFTSNCYEQNLCQMFNSFCQKWTRKQEDYVHRINQQILQKEQKELTIAEKEEQLTKQIQQMNNLAMLLVKQTQQKNKLYTQNTLLSQQLNNAKQSLTKQLSLQQTTNQNLIAKQSELLVSLEQERLKNNELSAQNKRLKQNESIYQLQMQELEAFLSEDLQRQKLNLITHNILIAQLNESYEQRVKQIVRNAAIHKENRQIVGLLSLIKQSLQINLSQIEDYNIQASSLSVCQGNFFDTLTLDFQQITKQLSLYSQSYSKLTESNTKLKQLLLQRQQKLMLKNDECNKLQEALQKAKIQNSSLNYQINKHKSQHYNTLIEVQKTKRKIQDSLLQNLQELKKGQEKYSLLEEQYKQQEQKAIQLSLKLAQIQEQRNALQEQCRQKQKANFQLKQQILNMKSNLDIMMKTQQDDEDSSFNIVQQLIDKNNELTNQMTLKKMQVDLKQQKIVYQEKIIQQLTQQIEHSAQQIERLNHLNKELQRRLQDVQKENHLSHQERSYLQQELQRFKQNQLKLALRKYNETSIQTDEIQHTVQSRIRKQIISQPQLKNQVQKSHSLLSQRNESKENMSNKANLLTNRQKQGYKDKIVTLNEIINYMLNYAKGYQCGQIRAGSWFSRQIEKYGTQYELRILDPSNLEPKIKNNKFIERLCKQDTTCNRLIKEFQSIMEFYFDWATKLSTSSLSITPITQQKLNKTVNKSRNPPANKYNF